MTVQNQKCSVTKSCVTGTVSGFQNLGGNKNKMQWTFRRLKSNLEQLLCFLVGENKKWPHLSTSSDVWVGGRVGSDDDRHDCCHCIVFIVTRLNNAGGPSFPKSLHSLPHLSDKAEKFNLRFRSKWKSQN